MVDHVVDLVVCEWANRKSRVCSKMNFMLWGRLYGNSCGRLCGRSCGRPSD